MTSSPPKTQYIWENAQAPHVSNCLLHPLSQLLPPPQLTQRTLDLGCGNGWLTYWLQQLGFTVQGIDPSPSGIKHSKAVHPDITFHCHLATPDLLQILNLEPFDLVVSTEVVEHCYAPRDWAVACYNSLNPGGQLICSTPYHGYLKNLMLALTGKLDHHFTALWDGGHIKFWSRSTLSKLLTETGFVDLKFLGAGRLPYLWQSMLISARKPS